MFRDGTSRAPKPSPLTRGGPLDGLRFLAAFCMVIYHYSAESPVALARLHPVFERGYLATDFFLIVSGYVMGRIYGEQILDGRIGTGAFLLRRAGRVAPAHLMVSAAFAGLALLAAVAGLHPLHPEWFDWRQLPGQVALVQAWGPFGGHGWNAPSWTLSALLACYLAFPTLWRGLARVGNPVVVLAVGVAAVVGANVIAMQAAGYPIYQMPMAYGAVRALPLFLLGASLAACSQRWTPPAPVAGALGLASLGLLVGVQAAPGRHDLLSLALIAVLVLAAGAMPVRRPSRLLARAALVSFALFITNELVRVIYFGVDHAASGRLGLGPSTQWAIWFGGLAAAVLFATGFHYLVDQPTQAWIRPRVARAPAWLKAQLAQIIPVPDPDFDPFRSVGERAPRVREIVLQVGPAQGAVHRRDLESPAGLAWG